MLVSWIFCARVDRDRWVDESCEVETSLEAEILGFFFFLERGILSA